jgi:hypothetical protein
MIIPVNSALFFEEHLERNAAQRAKHLKKTKLRMRFNSAKFRWIHVDSGKFNQIENKKSAREEPALKHQRLVATWGIKFAKTRRRANIAHKFSIDHVRQCLILSP